MTDVTKQRLGLLALALAAMLALLLVPKMTQGAHDYWLTAITNEVQGFQYRWGNFEPYLDQLKAVRTALHDGNQDAAYHAMNRFMDMLENREQGIAAPIADWLFDYCNMVTPVKFHDMSRHIRKIG